MALRILASDSLVHLRPSTSGQPFRGLIGVTLGIEDPDKFREEYDKIFQEFFQENRMERKRRVYKSFSIASLFPGPPYVLRGILRKLIMQFLMMENLTINVYFFTLNLKELREKKVEDEETHGDIIPIEDLVTQGVDAELIQEFGVPGHEALRYISVKDFFEKTSQYFPIVCSAHISSFASIKNCEIIMDGCSGYESKCLSVLLSSQNVISITEHGDEYNPFLSTADLITRWIHEELKQSRIPLNEPGLVRLLHHWRGFTSEINTDHIHIWHLSNKDLNDMKPISKKTIHFYEHRLRKHPTYYIFSESKDENEKGKIEQSPAMDSIINEVYDKNGSYCFWKPKEHARYILKNDVGVVYGDNGLTELLGLQALQYPITLWDLRK